MMGRADAVLIARSWLETPYILGARIKGAGCDCATLLAEYLVEIGACARESLGLYSHDWFCNTSSERYMIGLIRHARKTIEGVAIGKPDARPGDLVLFKVAGSRVFNHAGIVIEWPFMIHAVHPRVARVSAVLEPMTAHMEMAVFDPWKE